MNPLGIAALMLGAFAAGGAAAAELALRRVMLSAGGVAYVEYEGEVSGAAAPALELPLDQVDDVLKSLVVFDARGQVGGMSLPGSDNRQAAFAEVPFGPEALDSPLALLNGLRGVELEVRGAQPMRGRLLRAERMAEPGRGDPVERTRVSLLTADGLRQFVLEEADAVQVADAGLRERIGAALEALRHNAARSTRRLTLRAPGEGTRTLRVGYVVGAPLWKVSYRLVLPAGDAAAARLQGWAVLENTTGQDWRGVELTLQYGNPVTFRQAIYRSYFVQRPEVPVEVLGRLLPDADTRARVLPPPAPMPAGSAASRGALRAEMAAPAPPAAAMADMAAPAEAAAASEGAQETTFRLPVPVDLAAGHSASLPILDRSVAAERVFLLQAGRRHPLAAIRLANDSGTSLPAGVLTLYDPASPAVFAGDARLAGLPVGERRLLSFAEDLRTTAVWGQTRTSGIAAVSAAAGVLRVDERVRTTHSVTLSAPAGEARRLLVEIGRTPGADVLVADGAQPVEETATAWRFAVALAAGETRVLAVRSDRINRQETVLLRDGGPVLRLLGTSDLTPAARAALQRLADLRAALSAHEAELKRIEAQLASFERDQERVRRNLGAVPSNDALHGRLVRQLEGLESRLGEMRVAEDRVREAADQARRSYDEAAGRFSL